MQTTGLTRFAKIVAKQKFRFDLGQSFLTILNFSFIVIAAGNKIATVIHVPTKWLVVTLVPAAIAAVWTAGLILDKLQFWNHYTDELNDRNKILKKLET